jgi:hypothetical protein
MRGLGSRSAISHDSSVVFPAPRGPETKQRPCRAIASWKDVQGDRVGRDGGYSNPAVAGEVGLELPGASSSRAPRTSTASRPHPRPLRRASASAHSGGGLRPRGRERRRHSPACARHLRAAEHDADLVKIGNCYDTPARSKPWHARTPRGRAAPAIMSIAVTYAPSCGGSPLAMGDKLPSESCVNSILAGQDGCPRHAPNDHGRLGLHRRPHDVPGGTARQSRSAAPAAL